MAVRGLRVLVQVNHRVVPAWQLPWFWLVGRRGWPDQAFPTLVVTIDGHPDDVLARRELPPRTDPKAIRAGFVAAIEALDEDAYATIDLQALLESVDPTPARFVARPLLRRR